MFIITMSPLYRRGQHVIQSLAAAEERYLAGRLEDNEISDVELFRPVHVL